MLFVDSMDFREVQIALDTICGTKISTVMSPPSSANTRPYYTSLYREDGSTDLVGRWGTEVEAKAGHESWVELVKDFNKSAPKFSK